MTKSSWRPNEKGYSCCEFVARNILDYTEPLRGHGEKKKNTFPFVVAIWLHLKPMVVGRERAYGVDKVYDWVGG